MDLLTIIGNTLALILTLCIFSFLYKDNPFYKFAEHLVVGVSAGYFAVLIYFTGFIPKVWDPVTKKNEWWYILPAILGIMTWTRFLKKWSWISRFSIAFYMGIAVGVSMPLDMQGRVIRQLSATMLPVHLMNLQGIWNLLIVLGVLCGLVYFFFSLEHKGVVGGAASVGIWILMIGFGAGFGLTVMGRVSLLADRIQFMREWYLMVIKGVTGG
ncbi:MAG: hypothetical protein MUO91_08850 [candidate division Zixibacteria bacterium]|nr:hypothetical protein [candidate division Zixibacteria bacterium]